MNTRGGESNPAQDAAAVTLSTAELARFAKRVVWDLCWLWAGIAVSVAALRVVAHDRHLVLIAANSFSPYLYAPALLVLPLAIWRGRPRLAVLCAGLFLCQIIWVWPDYLPLLLGRHHVQARSVRPTS